MGGGGGGFIDPLHSPPPQQKRLYETVPIHFGAERGGGLIIHHGLIIRSLQYSIVQQSASNIYKRPPRINARVIYRCSLWYSVVSYHFHHLQANYAMG